MEQTLEWVKTLLEPALSSLGVNYSWVISVFTIIGMLRFFVKPVMSFVQAYVMATPSKSDDEFFAKVLDSKIYKTVSYLLDWFGSLKLPQKKA
jgi:hypothetical protein